MNPTGNQQDLPAYNPPAYNPPASSPNPPMMQMQQPPYVNMVPGYPTYPTYQYPQNHTVFIQEAVPVVTTQTTMVTMPLPNYVSSYTGYSIFNMIWCCFPLGLAALIFSCKTPDTVHDTGRARAAPAEAQDKCGAVCGCPVPDEAGLAQPCNICTPFLDYNLTEKTQNCNQRGDAAGAQQYSRTSFILNNIALGLGIAINVTWITLVVYFVVIHRPTYSSSYSSSYNSGYYDYLYYYKSG
ncbi:uncharacterized protein LOC144769662 [Lissotriton helveticus]